MLSQSIHNFWGNVVHKQNKQTRQRSFFSDMYSKDDTESEKVVHETVCTK